MDLRVLLWRSLGLLVVGMAVAIALWFMGQVANSIATLTSAPPTGSITATATSTAPSSTTP
jgi:hypothetical protein